MRARETIEKFVLQADNSQDLHVTMSFGVAELRKNEDQVALVGRADKTLYASKQGGRNCVFRHDGKNILRVESDKRAALAQGKGQGKSPAADEEPKKHGTAKAISNEQASGAASKPAGGADASCLPNCLAAPISANKCETGPPNGGGEDPRSRSFYWR